MTELFKNLPDPTKTEAEKLAEAAKPASATPTSVTPATAPTPPVVQNTTAPSTPTPPATTQQNEPEDEEETPAVIDELAMLKKRADLMQIKYSNNIGIDALKAKIQSKLDGEKDNTDENGNAVSDPEVTTQAGTNSTSSGPVAEPEKKISLRQYMQENEMKLVRLRITNLDPKKKDLPGEIITVANEYLGTVKKFVPFGEVTDGGYHVPYCIYNVLKERTFVSIKTRKGPRGQTIVENQDAREFSLEVLPALTASELAQLATAQQAKGGLETN